MANTSLLSWAATEQCMVRLLKLKNRAYCLTVCESPGFHMSCSGFCSFRSFASLGVVRKPFASLVFGEVKPCFSICEMLDLNF